jgi:hypothetical protein
MWRVTWQYDRKSTRGVSTKREHKYFTDEEHNRGESLRFAKRIRTNTDAEWVTTTHVETEV